MPKEKDLSKIKDMQNATMKLVIKTGFMGLKMADVAKEAGIATGTVYIYYKNKEALINDVYIETKREIISQIIVNDDISDFYSIFRKVWFKYFLFCYHNPEKMMFVDQFLYSGYINDEVYDNVVSLYAPIYLLMKKAQAENIIKVVDVEVFKSHLEGAIHETIKMMIKRKIAYSDELAEVCFQMAWDALKK